MGAGRVGVLCALFVISGSFSIRAQDVASTVEVDAMECWRRIGANAVHVGERFALICLATFKRKLHAVAGFKLA